MQKIKSIVIAIFVIVITVILCAFKSDKKGIVKNNDMKETISNEEIEIQTKIENIKDTNGNIIPVPEGFCYLEGTKETGVVIKNNFDGNEFVWIPVDIIEDGYNTKNWEMKYSTNALEFVEYYTEDNENNEKIINKINESVEKYKGYYIGRYEAGSTVKRTGIGNLTTPVCKPSTEQENIYAYNMVLWEEAVKLSEELYTKEKHNVQSRLINARSWDTALKFIEQEDSSYPTNGEKKGWYGENGYKNREYNIGKPVDSNISNKRKNIYDMAGNVEEWLAQQHINKKEKREVRGGSQVLMGLLHSASNRSQFAYNMAGEVTGFRVALYL